MAHRVNTQRDNHIKDRQTDRQENDAGIQTVAQKHSKPTPQHRINQS